MYSILIVDDELPALRFVCSIVEQFSTAFRVTGTASSGDLALDFLRKNPVDLLITDISMHGMNGIELALQARKLQPAIHILIISGYGEFEYAQGAIQVGVDDYILKPISISKMTATLNSIQQKLEAESNRRTSVLLPALACGQEIPEAYVRQKFGSRGYRFALVRWGNLDMTLPKALNSTLILPQGDEPFHILRGRDDREHILVTPDGQTDSFLATLSVYMTQNGNIPTWTAIFAPRSLPIEKLHDFIVNALLALYRKTVIGKHQILPLSISNADAAKQQLKTTDTKMLTYFLSVGRRKMIRDLFISLASEWERSAVPQRQAWHMCRQLVHQVATVQPPIYNNLESVMLKLDVLIEQATSYTELLKALYDELFENGAPGAGRMSTEELYDYAIEYINDNYAQPLSMQTLCDVLNISQTYLSRLFRKYSDTTFNTYLTRCRMEAAKKLLRERPDLLLRDVAACVGYDDSSYFTKVFHQYTGTTPSQYASSTNE